LGTLKLDALLLAAGKGTRLAPLTDAWPKCLMPIGGKALLEHWLCILHRQGIIDVEINLHHHRDLVREFLERKRFVGWARGVEERLLLGTAGTLREYARNHSSKPLMLIHADNWCQCDFGNFIDFHQNHRPDHTKISIMTFRTKNPESCGIVELDNNGVVVAFHEKKRDVVGNLANGAVYILEPSVLEWIKDSSNPYDISTDVVPHFLGEIATWENTGIHRDIGTFRSLQDAQQDPQPNACWPEKDAWQLRFECTQIFREFDVSQR
jgi:mannose-1-phosphate guanylyltransferase